MEAVKICVIVFFTVFVALRAVTSFIGRGKEEIAQRMLTLTRDGRINGDEKASESKKPNRRLINALRLFTPKGILDKAEEDLLQTDILLRPEELVFVQIGAVVVPSFAVFFLLGNAGLAAVLAIAGAIVPTLYIKSAKTRRHKKFNDQLGDAIGIMSNSLKAGFSFLQTLDSLHRETTPPLSVEFGRALREMKLGTPTEVALQNMTKRVHSDDFELIVTAVSIQRQVGGNLGEILDNIAFTIKERLRIKGEIKTLTAQGKISGIIVGALPILLGLVISVTNPSYMSILFRETLGMVLLGAAFVSQIIGIVLIKKIINIEI
jgi:tight adherence protein B